MNEEDHHDFFFFLRLLKARDVERDKREKPVVVFISQDALLSLIITSYYNNLITIYISCKQNSVYVDILRSSIIK